MYNIVFDINPMLLMLMIFNIYRLSVVITDEVFL